jgi:O-antigen ligase
MIIRESNFMDIDVSSRGFPIENQIGGGLLTANDSLINGIWPRSLALWMSVIYVLLFIIRPWEKLIPELAAFHFERSYAILMIIIVVLSGRTRLRLDLQSVSVLLFAFAMGISGLTTDIPVRTWFVPYEYITLIVFYFVLASVIRTPYELLFVITSYVAVMTIYLAKSQWEFFVHRAGLHEMGVLRLQGIDLTFGNDNALAASVNYSLPFLYVLFLVRKDLTAGWPRIWRKLFLPSLVFYTGLAVTSVFLTNSRTGVLGLMFCTVLLATRGKRLGRKVLASVAAGLLGFIVFAVLPAEMQERIRTVWDPDSGSESARSSAEGRWEGFHAGLKMFDDHPLTGVGVDNFMSYRVKYVDRRPSSAHNLFGELLGETGLLGAAAFVLLVTATLINCHKAQRLALYAPKEPVLWMMAQVALSCRHVLILLFFHGIASHNLERFNWLWAGAFCVLSVRFIMVALNRHATIHQGKNSYLR